MKRIIIITFALILICSTATFANSRVRVDMGLFNTKDADEYLPGAKINFRADSLGLYGLYDFLEVQYTRAGDFDFNDNILKYEHLFNNLNLLFVNQASHMSNDLNIALGVKYFSVENSARNSSVLKEDNNLVNVDIDSYGFPIVISNQDSFNEYIKFEMQGELLAIGRYEIALADDEVINSDFMGYGIDSLLKFTTHDNFAFNLGFSWHRYQFSADDSISKSRDFTDTQSGLYGGIEIAW